MSIDMTGIERIAAERKRQIEQEGWAPEHDDQYHNQQLMHAAGCYLQMGVFLDQVRPDRRQAMVDNAGPATRWPWEEWWWKPSPDPIRNLEKAGALIAAEIDRLERVRRKGGGDE